MAELPPEQRPDEEAERGALLWLMDMRAHGGSLDRRYAATIVETLAWFEAREVLLFTREEELAEAVRHGLEVEARLKGINKRLAEAVAAAQRYREIALADPTSLDRPSAGSELDRALAEVGQVEHGEPKR